MVADIEMLVNKNISDPIPMLKLELKEIENDNRKQRDAIKTRDEIIKT